jgi:nucleotide-binding universal stress UspA family protein
MQIRKILAAVARDAPDRAALRAATRLATAAEAQVAVSGAAPHGVPAVEIARAAEREGADLIVLPRDPIDTVTGTVRRARVPCLVVPPGWAASGKILAAIDGGPDSADVSGAASAIGELLRGKVITVRVERRSHFAVASLASAEWPHQRRDAIAGTGTATLASAEPVLVREGDPVAEILNLVRDVGIELLVFGHHRGGPSNGHETGSIAARLLARAPCAVLTVPI